MDDIEPPADADIEMWCHLWAIEAEAEAMGISIASFAKALGLPQPRRQP